MPASAEVGRLMLVMAVDVGTREDDAPGADVLERFDAGEHRGGRGDAGVRPDVVAEGLVLLEATHGAAHRAAVGDGVDVGGRKFFDGARGVLLHTDETVRPAGVEHAGGVESDAGRRELVVARLCDDLPAGGDEADALAPEEWFHGRAPGDYDIP